MPSPADRDVFPGAPQGVGGCLARSLPGPTLPRVAEPASLETGLSAAVATPTWHSRSVPTWGTLALVVVGALLSLVLARWITAPLRAEEDQAETEAAHRVERTLMTDLVELERWLATWARSPEVAELLAARAEGDV